MGWVFAPRELPTVVADPGADGAPQAGNCSPGPPVSNIKGTYQVAIVVVDGVVIEVRPLQAGTSAATSVLVNENALPTLEKRMLDAQSWDVQYVSGASFTSPAIVESAKGAFQQAGLG